MKKIGIIGSGIFGTALGITAARAGNDVICWDRKAEVINAINQDRINKIHLPEIKLPDNLHADNNLEDIFKEAETILITTAAQATREIFEQIKNYTRPETVLVLCAKGLESGSGKMLSEIAEEIIPQTKIAILSGPGFATDIARNKLVSVTIACRESGIARQLSQQIGTKYFRPYSTKDIISPQIGGSIKNVIAIASGIIEGAGLGEGARAALVTRGLAEMMRLSKALGGDMTTMMGMCGLGDLVLTSSCAQSRNFSLGYKIGTRGHAAPILAENKLTVEGIETARAVKKRSQELNVEMPICQVVNRILFEDISITSALEELISRPYKEEGF